MAKLADLPVELIDRIFAFVEDSSSLFPFLLSQRTHESARIALYQNATVREEKYEAFLEALLSNRRKLGDRATRPAMLRIDCSNVVLQPPYWQDEQLRRSRWWLELISTSVGGMLSAVQKLQILNAPDNYRHKIDHPNLEEVLIWQTGLEELEDDPQWGRVDEDNYHVTLEISGASSLKSLYVRTGILTVTGTSIVDTLTELCLLYTSKLVIDGTAYVLAESQGTRRLPFTKLRRATFLLPQGSTLEWLQDLSGQLLASKQTLQGLYLWGFGWTNTQRALATPVDLNAYTSLQELGVLAKLHPPGAKAGINNDYDIFDANRLRIISATINSVILKIRSMAKSSHAILTCIDDFLQDNASYDRMSSLQTIGLVIDESFVGELKQEHHEILMRPTEDQVDFYHKDAMCRHGNVARMPITRYNRIIAMSKELTTMHPEELAMVESRFGVKVDMRDVHNLLSREAMSETGHVYACHCE